MTKADVDAVLARLLKGRWFAAGALSIKGSTMRRLVDLGLVKKRRAPAGYLRTWDYHVL